MDRADLLLTALQGGAFYATFRILLAVFYPWLAGAIWQETVGPRLVRHWPHLAQGDDYARMSYLPERANQPAVVRLGPIPPSLNEITHGVRDGLLVGVLAALVPEGFQAGFLTLLLAFVLVAHAWRIGRAKGAAATDLAFDAIRECLMYAGAIASVRCVGLIG